MVLSQSPRAGWVDEFRAICPHQRHLEVGDHVADIADEDHRLPLGVGVEGVPHLPLVAVSASER